MHIQVKTLTGKTVNLEVTSETSVQALYELVQNAMSVPVEEQKLLFNGKLLVEGTVEEHGIKEEAAIHMLVAIEGGKGKKKKKKVKKTKGKHKKRKVKLAILGYYKVEGGVAHKLRQRSPSGTFMAEHEDRYYCGRTHITYKRKAGTAPKAKVEKEKPVAVVKDEGKKEDTKKGKKK